MTDQDINEAVARKLGLRDCGSFVDKETGGKLSDHIMKPDGTFISKCPDYCHSIEAAWEIVEKVDYICRIGYGKYYSCEFLMAQGERQEYYRAEADTAPMAICLAFLKLEPSNR